MKKLYSLALVTSAALLVTGCFETKNATTENMTAGNTENVADMNATNAMDANSAMANAADNGAANNSANVTDLDRSTGGRGPGSSSGGGKGSAPVKTEPMSSAGGH